MPLKMNELSLIYMTQGPDKEEKNNYHLIKRVFLWYNNNEE